MLFVVIAVDWFRSVIAVLVSVSLLARLVYLSLLFVSGWCVVKRFITGYF